MKPWCVLKFDITNSEPWLFQQRRVNDDPSFTTVIQAHDEFRWAGDTPNSDVSIFWCDSEADANALATVIGNRYPNNIYVVVKSTRVVRHDPGPERIAIFNEKGLMPQ